jgi:hypothetical protein
MSHPHYQTVLENILVFLKQVHLVGEKHCVRAVYNKYITIKVHIFNAFM